MPLSDRFANASIWYVEYIAKTFWPARLAASYPYPREMPVGKAAISTLLVIAATGGAVALFRRRPYVLIGWLWCLGTLIPRIGIVQVGTQTMAERCTYLPSLVCSPRWCGEHAT